jgi:hypothetical protein
MKSETAQYISASRRCDIPRFRSKSFFAAWKQGSIAYDGGYGRSYTVSLKPEDVLGYIFWSKDFGPFIDNPLFKELIESNNAVFHYTINDFGILEPGVPTLEHRLAVLYKLSDMVGPQRVFWRFDPICRYVTPEGKTVSTEKVFFSLLPQVQKAGVRRCYFSFMTLYSKTKSRPVQFLGFSDEEKKTIAADIFRAASRSGMTLYNCCNEEVPRLVPQVKIAHCVDDEILRETDRFGVHRPLKPAPTRAGCGCFESRDIGSYSPACRHGCVYCYANPAL